MAKKPQVSTPGDETAAANPSDAAATGKAGGDNPAHAAAPAPAPAAGELPDESKIDTDAIPFGKTAMSKQGHVCSTAPDPKRK